MSVRTGHHQRDDAKYEDRAFARSPLADGAVVPRRVFFFQLSAPKKRFRPCVTCVVANMKKKMGCGFMAFDC